MSSVTLYETASKMLEMTVTNLGDLSGYGTEYEGWMLVQQGSYPYLKSASGAPPASPAGALNSIQPEGSELKLYTSSDLPANSWVRLWNPVGTSQYQMFGDYSDTACAIYWNGPIVNYYLAVATVNGVAYLGVLAVRTDDVTCWGFFYSESAHQLYVNANISRFPGEPGFEPAGNKGHRPTGGGIDSGWKPVYPGDNLTQPGAPDESVASAAGSGFLTAYKISSNNLRLLGEALFGGLLTKLANIFVDPLDSIVSLQVFPCEPTVGSSEYIKLFNYSCKRDVLGVDTSAPPLTKQFKVFNFGTLSVAEMWNSFLDYDATSFELYLPFIGSVDIPVGEVMNGSINVQYTVDFFTGMCVANVLCTKTLTLSDGSSVSQQCQHSYMGNCSVQIPLHRESYASFVGALANAAASGLRAPVSLVQSALSGAFKPNIETKGTISANAGYCSILYPYITITRPVTAMPASYQEVVGFPCYVADKLSECQDLCVCDNIDLSGLAGATDSEMDRIRQMCKDGVYV